MGRSPNFQDHQHPAVWSTRGACSSVAARLGRSHHHPTTLERLCHENDKRVELVYSHRKNLLSPLHAFSDIHQSTVMLIANFTFLAVPGVVHTPTFPSTASQIILCGSVLTALASIAVSFVLLKVYSNPELVFASNAVCPPVYHLRVSSIDPSTITFCRPTLCRTRAGSWDYPFLRSPTACPWPCRSGRKSSSSACSS